MTDDAPAPETKAAPASNWLTGARAGYLALGVSVVALGLAAAPYFTGGGENVRAYLLKHPEVLQEASQALQEKGEQARVDETNQAAAANAALLKPDPRDPSFGPADAKVTVIEFFDFRCPGCKAVAHDYRALMAAHPEVRFVFKDWPILDRGEDVTSQYAARAALAAHQQGKYLEVYDALMTERALSIEAIDRILAEHGVDMTRAKAAVASPETTRHIADIHTTAAALRLQGTPTFLVNGKASPSIDPAEVGKMIEAAKR
ncbi:protein-disulfide isomerase [Brevundimonas nasdae]|jgi:protein-disulfide isomerase|uniref:Thioredoxin domain-containing protein n=2 Tax=Brevundimonas nasdae TaxID=172043 RepID=A0ABX8TIM1_9CAUL|nr:thioredoxin domain-containing protein [Brevundimonas nasdae]MBK6026055.1 thioredoxin domain-containing protein [Brevundimonas nasdae]MDQ0452703.1 protein-disulfide isomerase [Brevundimonas nasdae]QYC11107.1 thioredoxin domain-containing protein [Brevundimonas nasdae]QYC13894.1 thioredoxin domain-containing protein [Brevundimonas nasdae]